MSRWGVFKGDPNGVHVVPCSNEGIILEPHSLSKNCVCEPKEEDVVVPGKLKGIQGKAGKIFIHNDFN